MPRQRILKSEEPQGWYVILGESKNYYHIHLVREPKQCAAIVKAAVQGSLKLLAQLNHSEMKLGLTMLRYGIIDFGPSRNVYDSGAVRIDPDLLHHFAENDLVVYACPSRVKGRRYAIKF